MILKKIRHQLAGQGLKIVLLLALPTYWALILAATFLP
jgi:hypothetical protein